MRLYLEPKSLQTLAEAHRESYASAEPFPHAVIDGLFPDEMLETILAAFPDPDSNVWKEYDNDFERKLETQGEERLGDDVSLILYQFNSAPFLRFLERLSGINGLIPDPYFSGGGLHQILPGGKLGIHADFSRHGVLPLHRRINALIFLNKDWKDDYGGHLELWDRDMTECRARIAPLYNRMVVFTTTDWSFHGHPHPLRCPDGMSRRSIALYYFSVDRPADEVVDGKQSTYFIPLPGQRVPDDVPRDRGGVYSGLKVDRFKPLTRSARVKRVVRRWTPPIALDAARRLGRRS